jgi:hypothetical protein
VVHSVGQLLDVDGDLFALLFDAVRLLHHVLVSFLQIQIQKRHHSVVFCYGSNSVPSSDWESPRPVFNTGARNGVMCGSWQGH